VCPRLLRPPWSLTHHPRIEQHAPNAVALIARGSRAAARIGNVQQLEKVIFPEYGEVVGLVAAGFIAKRDENVAALLHTLDLALEDAEFRRVDFIIGGVDRE